MSVHQKKQTIKQTIGIIPHVCHCPQISLLAIVDICWWGTELFPTSLFCRWLLVPSKRLNSKHLRILCCELTGGYSNFVWAQEFGVYRPVEQHSYTPILTYPKQTLLTVIPLSSSSSTGIKPKLHTVGVLPGAGCCKCGRPVRQQRLAARQRHGDKRDG